MWLRVICVVLGVAFPVFGQDDPALHKAESALAKAKAELRREVTAWKSAQTALESAKLSKWEKLASTRSLDYDVGYRVAVRLGKPMVVVVNLDCKEMCKQLRPEFVTVHEKVFQGSDKSRVLLVVPVGEKMYQVKAWDGKLPTPEEIRSELKKSRLNGKAEDYHDFWSSVVLLQLPWGDCPGGVCPVPNVVPGSGNTGAVHSSSVPIRMPIGDGPVVYSVVVDSERWVVYPQRLPLLRRSLFLVRRILGSRLGGW